MNEATKEQYRQYVERWRVAGEALENERYRELNEMTDAEALRISRMLLSMPPGWRADPEWSGLIEQQALFHRKKLP